MINTIIGLMNSGKTLYMTYKLFLAWCSGKTIITNYDLTFPHIKVNEDWLIDLSRREDLVLDNVAMGFDEIWIWLDARKSMSNTVSTYFFLQSSKSDTEIYMTAQDNLQNDIRIRRNQHKLSQCSRVLLQNNKFVPINEEKRFLTPQQQKNLYIKVVEFKKINIGFMTDLKPSHIEYIKADIIFKLYDTRQKIVAKK